MGIKFCTIGVKAGLVTGDIGCCCWGCIVKFIWVGEGLLESIADRV
jgi:hypothetical protein